MSVQVDEKFLDLISVNLDRFHKKSPTLYNSRCYVCGDSKTNSRLTRAYYFIGRDNDSIICSCHNCGLNIPFGLYLKEYFPEYYTQYKLESMQKTTKLTFKSNKIEPKKVEPSKKYLNILPKQSAIKVSELPKSHEARKYLEDRLIEDLDRFYFAENFQRYVEEQTGGNEQYAKVPQDKRIILPIKSPDNTSWGFQGRSLDKASKLRYITIKESEQFCKVFGLEYFDKNKAGFVLEGPFDSTFIPNAVSMCGSSLDPTSIENGYIIPKNTIIVYDNEKRNKEIVDKMAKMLDAGFRVYIPPTNLTSTQKDINDMILSGRKKEDIVRMIVSNSYSGISGKVVLNQWKKV